MEKTYREHFSLKLGYDDEGTPTADQSIINDAADRIFEEMKTVTKISWEDWMESYMKRHIPEYTSIEDPAYLIMVNERPKHVVAVIDQLTELKRDCYLNVDRSEGIVVLTGGDAKSRINSKAIRKNINVATNQIKNLQDEDERTGAISPNPLILNLRQNLITINGSLDFSDLTDKDVKGLKRKIQRSLSA